MFCSSISAALFVQIYLCSSFCAALFVRLHLRSFICAALFTQLSLRSSISAAQFVQLSLRSSLCVALFVQLNLCSSICASLFLQLSLRSSACMLKVIKFIAHIISVLRSTRCQSDQSPLNYHNMLLFNFAIVSGMRCCLLWPKSQRRNTHLSNAVGFPRKWRGRDWPKPTTVRLINE